MTHRISAYIGGNAAIRAVAPRLDRAKIYRLRYPELFVVPVNGKAYRPGADVIEGYWRFNTKFREIGRVCSTDGPLVYVETAYFGGEGTQAATVWIDGEEAFGPTIGDIGVINTGLRMIGVVCTVDCDEFDTIGLRDFRGNEDFDELEPG
jgi:hypothetical protein